LALATLIGGGLIQYAPFPTRLNFWVLFFVLAAIFVAAWFLPRHAPGKTSARRRPRVLAIPRGIRKSFAVSVIAVTSAYALGPMMLSLGAQTAHDLIGSNNVLVSSAAIALFASVWGVTGILGKRLPSRAAIMLGGAASTIGMGLLALAAARHALPLFLAATASAGVGYSLLFLGGLNLISASAPEHHRGGTLSAVYLVAYLMMGIIALLLGAAATAWGLEIAIDLGAGSIAALSLTATALSRFVGRGKG
jgi:MFS family permease